MRLIAFVWNQSGSETFVTVSYIEEVFYGEEFTATRPTPQPGGKPLVG
jgi:hypothetical protein